MRIIAVAVATLFTGFFVAPAFAAGAPTFAKCEALAEKSGAGAQAAGSRNHRQFMADCMAGKLPELSAAPKNPAPAQTASMAGAHGPLSPRQSKAILANLSSRSEETDIFKLHLALEEKLAGSPLMVSNRTTLLQDGESTYAAMLKVIAAANPYDPEWRSYFEARRAVVAGSDKDL